MKCIHCGKDVRYPDRRDGRCDGCREPFAFEPKRADPFTDKAFQDAIETLSGRGRLRWGVEHLHWELARRLARRTRGLDVGCAVVAGAAAAFFSFLGYVEDVGFALVALALAGLFVLALWRLRQPGLAAGKLPVARFNDLWQRWSDVKGRPESAIERLPKGRRPPPAEVDLYDYSFDRVVVCDRARTVDLLVANNFHFENNCAVLSIAGYPEDVFEPVRAMLKRNPRLEIFALHDATPFGCRVAHRLSTDPAWFQGQRVHDVGLRPGHAARRREYWLGSEVRSVELGGGLTAQEAAWLSRYRMELAVYRPEAILRALFRAINRREELAMPAAAHAPVDDGDDGGFDSFG